MSRFNVKDFTDEAESAERFSTKRKSNHARRDRQHIPDKEKEKPHTYRNNNKREWEDV